MARIIKKGNQLEEKYYAIRQERADKIANNMRAFCKAVFVSIMIYGATIAVSAIADIFSIAFMPLTMYLGFVLLIAVFVNFGYAFSANDTDILVSGINGERIATKILSTLPDGYTVFQNVIVNYDKKKSEIDNIVVGRSGVFIVEVKNHNGHIEGNLKDKYWIQHKVGRGGTPYTDEMYNPVKQVGTQIYCLANYLRQNGVNTYIEGVVYFANNTCSVSLTGSSHISIYSSFNNDEDQFCKRILSGNHNLDLRSVNQICKLISQL